MSIALFDAHKITSRQGDILRAKINKVIRARIKVLNSDVMPQDIKDMGKADRDLEKFIRSIEGI